MSSFGVCSAVTHAGTRCTSAAVDDSGKCAHHARMARVMALAPKSSPKAATPPATPTPSAVPPSSVVNAAIGPSTSGYSTPAVVQAMSMTRVSPSVSGGASSAAAVFSGSSGSRLPAVLLGEVSVTNASCSFIFPSALQLPPLQGMLYITNFRLRFEPATASLRSPGHLHVSLDDALAGIPRACVAKLSYPHSTQQRSRYDATPNQLVIKFKDLRSWTLGGDVHTLMMTLNRHAFVESPLSLFAFVATPSRAQHESVDPREREFHLLYDLHRDFMRMGVDLRQAHAYRVTDMNRNYGICPTYPTQLVVPAPITDAEIREIAEFRSKGRLPICCFVHPRNSASIWRCAQPKRGILNAQNAADDRYLAYIAQINRSQRKIWVADCRPELNARANNFTGGGTESSSIPHATVTFLNIANIHAMRDSLEGVRGLLSTTNPELDFTWYSRVEETKWLQHVRLVLAGALRVADAVENKQTTVLVHCSDGWDRTGQLCALSQIFLDKHYRTMRGFLEIIEKEWLRVGHKFQDRVGPGKSENDEQSPIFLQFLDCVWQLWRQYPTHFEFNTTLLEVVAEELFSGRFGTFLGNCDRERSMWNVSTRTHSLWRHVFDHFPDFVNPFYRERSERVLLPTVSSVLRNVVLWTDFYGRAASLPTKPTVNSIPPNWAPTGHAPARTVNEELVQAMSATIQRVGALEVELRKKTTQGDASLSPPPPASSMTLTTGEVPNSSIATSTTKNDDGQQLFPANTSGQSDLADQPPPPSRSGTWTCTLCSKVNPQELLKCSVCGRPPQLFG